MRYFFLLSRRCLTSWTKRRPTARHCWMRTLTVTTRTKSRFPWPEAGPTLMRLHLAREYRDASRQLRLRSQGSGASPRGSLGADRRDQRTALGRPFRSVAQGGRGDAPPRSAADTAARNLPGRNAPPCWTMRFRPASAIIRRSNSCCGPARAPRKRWSPPHSKPRARRERSRAFNRHCRRGQNGLRPAGGAGTRRKAWPRSRHRAQSGAGSRGVVSREKFRAARVRRIPPTRLSTRWFWRSSPRCWRPPRPLSRR